MTNRTEMTRDLAVSASGIGMPAGASAVTGDDVLFAVALINGLLTAAYLLYRWYWTARKVKRWEREQRTDPRQPPPDLGSVEADE